MRGARIVGVAAALALVMGQARAGTDYPGRILVGHPLTATPLYAVGDRLAPCDPTSPFNGIDSVWFGIPGKGGLPVRLVVEPTLDANAYFWVQAGSSCDLIVPPNFDFPCARRGLGRPETCTVPTEATHMTVEGYLGSGSFTATIG